MTINEWRTVDQRVEKKGSRNLLLQRARRNATWENGNAGWVNEFLANTVTNVTRMGSLGGQVPHASAPSAAQATHPGGNHCQ